MFPSSVNKPIYFLLSYGKFVFIFSTGERETLDGDPSQRSMKCTPYDSVASSTQSSLVVSNALDIGGTYFSHLKTGIRWRYSQCKHIFNWHVLLLYNVT